MAQQRIFFHPKVEIGRNKFMPKNLNTKNFETFGQQHIWKISHAFQTNKKESAAPCSVRVRRGKSPCIVDDAVWFHEDLDDFLVLTAF